MVKFATDITQRRAVEQELRAAVLTGPSRLPRRSTFLANMSHEIRTPMNAIIGFAKRCLDTSLEAGQCRHLATVHQAARDPDAAPAQRHPGTAKPEKRGRELRLATFGRRVVSRSSPAAHPGDQAVGSRRKSCLVPRICKRRTPAGAAEPGWAIALKFTERAVLLRLITTMAIQTRWRSTGIGIAAASGAHLRPLA